MYYFLIVQGVRVVIRIMLHIGFVFVSPFSCDMNNCWIVLIITVITVLDIVVGACSGPTHT